MSTVGGAERVGVLVMAHGTPARPEDLERFYTSIRRGQPPDPEQLEALAARYRAIGGLSPLAERTRAQADRLAGALHAEAPGRYVVRLGTKHADPPLEEAAAELARARVAGVVGLVLTPHDSSRGTGEYLERAAAALAGAGVPFVGVRQWYGAEGFADLMAERVLAARDRLTHDTPGRGMDADHRHLVLFTAHSLPERTRAEGDPYAGQVEDSAALVAETAEVEDWRVAWQSAGRTPEPWMGPDLLEVVAGLPAEGVSGVVVCPIGFTADHLEVLYDIDVEAAAAAREAGVALVRTDSLNDDPALARILASVVRRAEEDLVRQGP